jgi:hypothetical protein
MGMRIEVVGDKEAMVMNFRSSKEKAISREVSRVRQILGLDPVARQFRVVYGAYPANDKEIAILSRSMLQVMIQYASYIDVPASDIAEGRIVAAQEMEEALAARFPPLLRVQHGASKPDDAHVAVPYRDRWFWIEDRDYHTKVTFYFLMLLFSLTERGGVQGAPVVTVPTN